MGGGGGSDQLTWAIQIQLKSEVLTSGVIYCCTRAGILHRFMRSFLFRFPL